MQTFALNYTNSNLSTLNFFLKYPNDSSNFSIHLPSSRQQVDFNKGVGVAIVVPWCEVPCLENMNNEVAQLLVIIDLKLQKQVRCERKHGQCDMLR